MKTIVIANCNEILNEIQKDLVAKYNAINLTDKDDLDLEPLGKIKPDYIFFCIGLG